MYHHDVGMLWLIIPQMLYLMTVDSTVESTNDQKYWVTWEFSFEINNISIFFNIWSSGTFDVSTLIYWIWTSRAPKSSYCSDLQGSFCWYFVHRVSWNTSFTRDLKTQYIPPRFSTNDFSDMNNCQSLWGVKRYVFIETDRVKSMTQTKIYR